MVVVKNLLKMPIDLVYLVGGKKVFIGKIAELSSFDLSEKYTNSTIYTFVSDSYVSAYKPFVISPKIKTILLGTIRKSQTFQRASMAMTGEIPSLTINNFSEMECELFYRGLKIGDIPSHTGKIGLLTDMYTRATFDNHGIGFRLGDEIIIKTGEKVCQSISLDDSEISGYDIGIVSALF